VNRAGRESALMALGIATRERVDDAMLRVYLDDERVKAFTDEEFAQACRDLMTADWFPKLGELVKACQCVRLDRYRQWQESEEQVKANARRLAQENFRPFTKEESRAILAKLYAAANGIKPGHES
jgi:oligoribonuclease NrnB/cAMP/cGMP phosphodiesterase (DHH superfamily)